MNKQTFDDGIEISLPASYRVQHPSLDSTEQDSMVSARRNRIGFKGPQPMPAQGPSGKSDIIKALEKGGLHLARELEIYQELGVSDKRLKNASAIESPPQVKVPVSVDEDAVILFEQDGILSWKYPDQTEAGSNKRHAEASVINLPTVLTFTLTSATTGEGGGTRNILGKIWGAGFNVLKVYILKFAASKTVSIARDLLEKNITTGLIHIPSADLNEWRPIEGLANLHLPEDRDARLLLFVHGTFSSSVGAFGALAGTPWGQSFLSAAFENYDAVIGFDHHSLNRDPLVNAEELLAYFEQYQGWPLAVDIITHSRGGLVVRSLTEKLLPQLSSPILTVDKVIFVGSTNGGTLLAEPSNWESLIDLYTNLIMGTSRVIGMISPQTAVVSEIISDVLQNIGRFVKYCAMATITDRLLPGLSAMEPNGVFIKDINLLQDHQPGADQSYYCVISSEFKPSITGDKPKELPKRLLGWLGSNFMEQLMKEANDLVVNTRSMGMIDMEYGQFVKERFDFGINSEVYHTNYFTRPEVANALTRWLQLKEASRPTYITRSNKGITSTYSTGLVKLPGLQTIPGLYVPLAVDTDIIIYNTAIEVSVVKQGISKTVPSYVVFTRDLGDQRLKYAFKGEEVLNMIGNKAGMSALEAMGLHEGNASGEMDIRENVLVAKDTENYYLPSERRNVVMEGDMPVGVYPEKEIPDAEQLVAAARAITTSATEFDKIIQRRVMPSFTEEALLANTGLENNTPEPVCYVHAEMEQEVVLHRTTTVEVEISREAIVAAVNEVSVIESIRGFQEDEKLIINVIGKHRLVNIGDDNGRAEIDVPAPGQPYLGYFDLRATEEGKGEAWVIVRQGQMPLAKLVLQPEVVLKRNSTVEKIKVDTPAMPVPPSDKPLHQLWIEEINEGGQYFYQFTVNSPANGIMQRFKSGKLEEDRVSYVADLYKTIEDFWVSKQIDANNLQDDLRGFGAVLFQKLIPDPLKKILWENREKFDSIWVISFEPFIPWELVHLQDPTVKGMPEGIWFLGQMGLVRWLNGAGKNGFPPKEIKIRNGRVKYIIPDYQHPQYQLLEAQKEKAYLKQEFDAGAISAKAEEVRTVISRPDNFDLLHFAGHGESTVGKATESAILMEGRIEDVNGVSNYIPLSFKESTVRSYGNLAAADNAPMVVLNACQVGRLGYHLTGVGGFADAFLFAGAGAFVGTLWAVGDHTARNFTEALYAALRRGANLSEATREAREIARLKMDSTWLAYVVYGHPHMKISR